MKVNFKRGLIIGGITGAVCLMIGIVIIYFIPEYYSLPFAIGVSVGAAFGNFIIHSLFDII